MSATNTINVLLIVRWPVGGIRTFFKYYYNRFSNIDWHFYILAPDIPETKIMLNDLSACNVTYLPIKCNVCTFEFFYAISKYILISSYKFNLIHTHGYTSGICTSIPAYIRQIPHIMTSHDVFNNNNFNGFIGNFKKRVIYKLLTFINCIHSVSKSAQDNLFHYFGDLIKYNNKCVVLYNGIDVDKFFNSSERLFCDEIDLPDNALLIGYFGRFMSQKGFRYLIHAIKILSYNKHINKTPLVLAFGDGGFINEDKQLIKKMGLEKHFRFMPFKPDIASSIKGVDVVVMPSIWEACSLLAMETLVCGTPLIATNCIGLGEIVENSPTYIIPPCNAQSLADALLDFISNPNRSDFLAYSIEAKRRFNVDDSVVKLLTIYNNLLSKC